MWTVIYITSYEKIAERIRQQLVEEGFLIKVRQNKALQQFEILVPEGEIKEVKEVLASLLP